MAVDQAAERSELLALRLSLALTILFTASAFAIAFASDSETMTLEAMSGLVDVVVSLLAIFVAGKVRAPANQRYHFGYAKYESLMIAVEGTLIAVVCLSAIANALKDLVHPDPIEDSQLVIAYALAGFLLSVGFGGYMRRLGRRAASPMVVAESELWMIEGWLSLGICAAFVAALVLSRSSRFDYSAYVDPAVCIVLSLILLRKPLDILRESFLDLVDANPYAETRNAIEQEARECVSRYGLSGLEWVRLRRAGRRVFVLVSFFAGRQRSVEALDGVRTRVTEDLAKVNPDLDVSVLFRGADTT
jgi:cation diffusion facilitator family transporter